MKVKMDVKTKKVLTSSMTNAKFSHRSRTRHAGLTLLKGESAMAKKKAKKKVAKKAKKVARKKK
jgi:hypothetical protein